MAVPKRNGLCNSESTALKRESAEFHNHETRDKLSGISLLLVVHENTRYQGLDLRVLHHYGIFQIVIRFQAPEPD